MIKSLQLKTEVAKQYTTGEEDNNLNNLSRINIFIGPNNSGKSRFMRDLFIENDIKYSSKQLEIKSLLDCYSESNEKLNNLSINYQFSRQKNYKIDNFEILEEYNSENLKILIKEFEKIIPDNQYTNQRGINIKIFEILNNLLNNYKINNIKSRINDYDFSNKAIYIPILRGLRSINYQNEEFTREDFYFDRTINDYFKDSEIEFNTDESTKSIFTGLSLYDDVQELLLGNHEQRKLVKDFEIFLSKTFFQNKKITIIPRLKEKDVYINIEGEKEDRPIYNLGEGVQAIIILTYPLFFNKGKNLKIYIEEPDVYLHPGFQRILIETLLNTEGFKDFQYFFTTHSNHFLDMTLDYKEISVYKFTKEKEQFHIHNIDNPDITLLEHLGVKNSSVFLTNCTIWVEGITDRIYIRKYLELFQESLLDTDKKYFEDVHYSFVEYGGNNITHWSFLDKEDHPINVEKLCGKLFLLTDNDNAKEGSEKYNRIQQLKENLGERYYCLNVKEIENLLTKDALLKTLKVIDKANDKDKIKFKDNNQFRENSAVGTFIDNHFEGLKKKKYSTDSGTIKDKVLFAQGVIQIIKNFDDVRPEAKSLVEKIYNFIKENN